MILNGQLELEKVNLKFQTIKLLTVGSTLCLPSPNLGKYSAAIELARVPRLFLQGVLDSVANVRDR